MFIFLQNCRILVCRNLMLLTLRSKTSAAIERCGLNRRQVLFNWDCNVVSFCAKMLANILASIRISTLGSHFWGMRVDSLAFCVTNMVTCCFFVAESLLWDNSMYKHVSFLAILGLVFHWVMGYDSLAVCLINQKLSSSLQSINVMLTNVGKKQRKTLWQFHLTQLLQNCPLQIHRHMASQCLRVKFGSFVLFLDATSEKFLVVLKRGSTILVSLKSLRSSIWKMLKFFWIVGHDCCSNSICQRFRFGWELRCKGGNSYWPPSTSPIKPQTLTISEAQPYTSKRGIACTDCHGWHVGEKEKVTAGMGATSRNKSCQ